MKSPGELRLSTNDMLPDDSHGWRWVDRSGWTPEEEVENVKKAINGKPITERMLISQPYEISLGSLR